MLAAKEAGVEDETDLMKLSHNPEFAHLCETARPATNLSAKGFLSRMRLNPGVTNNVPELTEWVEWMMPRPFHLMPVPLASAYRDCAPWRFYKPKRIVGTANVKQVIGSACYPFIAHDPRKTTGADLVAKVNKAVPRGLPEEIRADICQDLICAILAGEMTEADLQGNVRDFVKTGRKMFADKWAFVNLDAEVPGFDGITYMDSLAGDINADWSIEQIDLTD